MKLLHLLDIPDLDERAFSSIGGKMRLYDKGSAPPPPDYTGAAQATAAGNLANARSTTQANRVDTFTPFGNLTYKNGQTFDQTGYDAAMAKYNASAPGTVTAGQDGSTTTQGAAPNRDDFMTGNPDQWSSTVTLAPDQQALLDQQNKTSRSLANLQDSATGRVGDAMSQPFDMSQVPDRGPMGQVLDPSKLPAYLPMGDVYTQRQQLAGAYDPNSAPKLSSYYDPQQDTNTATQAILSRVAPQLQRDKATMDTQLANQGITQGSEAYKNAQDQFGRQANDAYTQAGLQGINLGMAQQGQNFGQSVQGINTGMAQQGQMFGQTLQDAGFRQGEQAQQFGQQNTNYENSAAQRSQAAALQAQQFGQQQTNYQDSTDARQQAIQQEAYLRSLPLNELNSLRTGSQMTGPTFSNAPQQQYTPGPDILGATNQMYGAQVNAANAQNAAGASTTQGIASVAATAAMIF